MSQASPTINLCAAAKEVQRSGSRWEGTLNNLIAWRDPSACHNNEPCLLERIVPAMPSPLAAVSGLCHGLAMEQTLPPTADSATGHAVVDMKGVSGMPASVGAVQRQWTGPDPNQPCEFQASASDPDLVVPVIASPAEVFRARELREQIKKRYLNRPNQPCSPWCVGID